MRRNKAETAESRLEIVKQAARLFRERGPERVSVADVMAAAGMTHGGFYKHFESKEALFAAALESVFAERLDLLSDDAEGAAAALRRFLDQYLSLGHALNPDRGCPIAGLGADAGRASPPVQAALSEGTAALLERFAAAMDSEAAAIRTLASAVGAIVLARAVEEDALKRRILDVTAQATRDELAPRK